MTSDALVDRLRPRLAQRPEVLAWYLLGSAARDQLRPDSDLDLAVLAWPDRPVNRLDLLRWAGTLALELGRDVDVGLIDDRNLVYAKEALSTGVLVLTADEALTRQRGAQLLSQYLRFQDDRKEVLDAYRAR